MTVRRGFWRTRDAAKGLAEIEEMAPGQRVGADGKLCDNLPKALQDVLVADAADDLLRDDIVL